MAKIMTIIPSLPIRSLKISASDPHIIAPSSFSMCHRRNFRDGVCIYASFHGGGDGTLLVVMQVDIGEDVMDVARIVRSSVTARMLTAEGLRATGSVDSFAAPVARRRRHAQLGFSRL